MPPKQPTNAEIMAKIQEVHDDVKQMDTILRGNGKTSDPGLIAEVAENKRKLASASKFAWTAATAAIGAIVAAIWALLTGQTTPPN